MECWEYICHYTNPHLNRTHSCLELLPPLLGLVRGVLGLVMGGLGAPRLVPTPRLVPGVVPTRVPGLLAGVLQERKLKNGN